MTATETIWGTGAPDGYSGLYGDWPTASAYLNNLDEDTLEHYRRIVNDEIDRDEDEDATVEPADEEDTVPFDRAGIAVVPTGRSGLMTLDQHDESPFDDTDMWADLYPCYVVYVSDAWAAGPFESLTEANSAAEALYYRRLR